MKRYVSLVAVLALGMMIVLFAGLSLRPAQGAAPVEAHLHGSGWHSAGRAAAGYGAAHYLDASPAITWTPWFSDVSAEMNATAPGYGTGVAWGDYDGDGDLDLYVVNLGAGGAGQANVLLRNDGSAFVDVTGQAGVGDDGPGVAAAWADYDNDGHLDLFVSNRPGNNVLYRNDGAAAFQDMAGAAGVSDYNGMGEGVAWADDDRDGWVDLYVANYTLPNPPHDQPNRLFRNLDGSQFEDVADGRLVADGGNGEGIAWGDFDNDGDLDLYVANAAAGGTNVFFQRQDDGTFADVTAQMHVAGGAGSSYGVAWGDYDNDGWLDLYVAQQGANKLYRNLEGADFADATGQAGVGGDRWSLGCAWGDFDNDGWLDLHVANASVGGYNPGDVLYRNQGGSPVTFGDVTALAGITNTLDARGSAWGDYDGDGDLDLYVVNQGAGQANRLFRNAGSANHWLVVILTGRASNRAGIGARVTVASDGDQIREISGGSGFASQDSLPAEFGLGSWGGPVDVTVRWPSGIESSLVGVAVDQAMMMTESAPDLSRATKGVSADATLPGETLTYTIVVPNDGDWSAPASVTDTLPAGLEWGGYLTATGGTPTWGPAGQCVLWRGAIGEGAAVTLTYRVAVDWGLASGVTITNVATVDDGYRPAFDTPPVTTTVLCQELIGASFDYEPVSPVAGQGMTFTAMATGSLPVSYKWDLGDGSIASGAMTTHTYDAAGNYRVTLTATNDCSYVVVSGTVAVMPASGRSYLPLVVRDLP